MTSKPNVKGSKTARLSMARLAAVQCVYQWLQSGTKADELLTYYQDYYRGMEVEGEKMLPPDAELFHKIVKGVQERFDFLKEMIEENTKKEGQPVDKNKDLIILSVLYCGAYELMAHHEIDAPIVISDYIHITKSFYEGAETKLVNAVLDALKPLLRV